MANEYKDVYLTEKELMQYLNVCRMTARRVGEKAGARVKLLKAVRYEKSKIDEYIKATN